MCLILEVKSEDDPQAFSIFMDQVHALFLQAKPLCCLTF